MEISRDFDEIENFIKGNELTDIESVKKIVEDVKLRGDEAVIHYTSFFDKIKLTQIKVDLIAIKEAYQQTDSSIIEIIKQAALRIELFAMKQMNCFQNFTYEDDIAELGQKIVPLDSVGCYIPGGRYPLFSTVLMTVIPAKVAGVKKIIVCTPKIHPLILIAADIAGASAIYQVGGAQAISSMAYGTESIPKVCKIVGPGNRYVTYAKKLVYGEVGIDFVAGPSEILIIADESGVPSFIAADLLAQAEHDPNAVPILLTTSDKLAESVLEEINIQLNFIKTSKIAKLALQNGKILIVQSLEDAIEISNRVAPEHLELQLIDVNKYIPRLKNYGSMFIGAHSAEVFGDYYSGPNHVLPTNGAARYSGGLSVKDFLKILTFQRMKYPLDPNFIKNTSKMAHLEGLDAHRNAASIRQEIQ